MKLYRRKNVLYLYIVFIFLISLIPSHSVQVIHVFGIDKLFHLVEYLILGLIFKYTINQKNNAYYFLILIVPILDEFGVQRLSGRTIDPWDFIFNLIGLCLGMIIKEYIDKRIKY